MRQHGYNHMVVVFTYTYGIATKVGKLILTCGEVQSIQHNCISSVMVSMLTLNVVDQEFNPPSGQTKENDIGICCFSAQHAVLRSKSKDWSTRNQNNVSEWSDMSTHKLLFQFANTKKTQLSVLVYYKEDFIISLKCNLFSP